MITLTKGQLIALGHYLSHFNSHTTFQNLMAIICNDERDFFTPHEHYEDFDNTVLYEEIMSLSRKIDEVTKLEQGWL